VTPNYMLEPGMPVLKGIRDSGLRPETATVDSCNSQERLSHRQFPVKTLGVVVFFFFIQPPE
jgi:hypothetical protein